MSGLGDLRFAKPSLPLRLASWVVSRGKPIFPERIEDVERFLHSRRPPRRAEMPAKFARRFQVETSEVEGQECITLHPPTGPGERHILYFHGGGFVVSAVKQHWDVIAALVENTGASVTAAFYNVVPEHPYGDAERMADALFASAAENREPAAITLAGDSAGAHIALSLALRLRDKGGLQAGNLVLFSPWLDVTLKDEAAKAIEPYDIMLKVGPIRELGRIWAGDRDPLSPQCSPLYADLTDLPPTAIFIGHHDVFLPDCRTFAGRMKQAGRHVELYEYAGAPHVFMALAATREAKDVFALVARFVDR